MLVGALILILGAHPASAPAPQPGEVPGTSLYPPVAAHLVDLRQYAPDLLFDLRYARPDNVFAETLYPLARPLATRGTAAKLVAAQRALAAAGYRLVVWDAYRPLSVQKRMFELFPDERYVADPGLGSKHNRAAAVDVTLASPDGTPLTMPSAYDWFGPEARLDWPGHPSEVLHRAKLLQQAMFDAGFVGAIHEWWHFADRDWEQYPVLDLPLDVAVPTP
jgi:D-alanyl-D-alanine dipeptidase